MFQLTEQEKREVITDCDHLAKLRFSPDLPYAFTEHGALMAANVLNSERAVEVKVHEPPARRRGPRRKSPLAPPAVTGIIGARRRCAGARPCHFANSPRVAARRPGRGR